MNNVTLITTTFNEADNVESFLVSYRAQTLHANEFIIVDGGSRDGTVEIVERFAAENKHLNIRLLVDRSCSREFTPGPIAKGRNVAIENASSEVIAATDAGCVLATGWLEEITRPFADPLVDVVAGWYEPFVEDEFQKVYAEVFLPKLNSLNREDFLPSSRSVAFKKSCWSRVGGYPVKTYTAEDTMYNMLLRKAKCRFVFAEKAVVYWRVPNSLAEVRKKHFHYGYGDGQYGLFRDHYLAPLNLLKLFFPLSYLITRKLDYKGLLSFKVAYSIHFWSVLGYLNGIQKGIN